MKAEDKLLQLHNDYAFYLDMQSVSTKKGTTYWAYVGPLGVDGTVKRMATGKGNTIMEAVEKCLIDVKKVVDKSYKV